MIGKNMVVPGPAEAMMAVNLVNKTIDAIKEYSISHDREITERERIRATLVVALKAIDSNVKIVSQLLSQKHKERMKLYESFQACLVVATNNNDVAMVGVITKIMLETYDKGENLSQLPSYNASARELTHEE